MARGATEAAGGVVGVTGAAGAQDGDRADMVAVGDIPAGAMGADGVILAGVMAVVGAMAEAGVMGAMATVWAAWL